jgi:hypothetical protein
MEGFKRSTVILGNKLEKTAISLLANPVVNPSNSNDVSVLVLNSSHEMAKEITLQLTLKIPGCSIQYAPTIQLAKWMLGRKKIDLIVASPILPDGHISVLKTALGQIETPPDLVVVGAIDVQQAEQLSAMGYEYSRLHRVDKNNNSDSILPIIHKKKVTDSIKTVGADLRNDLNNPLQEIVAMVFVAKESSESGTTNTALEAIDKAAQNLAGVVSGIESRIMNVVQK